MKNLPCNPLKQPIWTDEEREKLVHTIESHGENYDELTLNVGNKSKQAIIKHIKRVTERFNAKEDLSEFEQKLILALHKPKVTNAIPPIIEPKATSEQKEDTKQL